MHVGIESRPYSDSSKPFAAEFDNEQPDPSEWSIACANQIGFNLTQYFHWERNASLHGRCPIFIFVRHAWFLSSRLVRRRQKFRYATAPLRRGNATSA
jgi:hypothetical protein